MRSTACRHWENESNYDWEAWHITTVVPSCKQKNNGGTAFRRYNASMLYLFFKPIGIRSIHSLNLYESKLFFLMIYQFFQLFGCNPWLDPVQWRIHCSRLLARHRKPRYVFRYYLWVCSILEDNYDWQNISCRKVMNLHIRTGSTPRLEFSIGWKGNSKVSKWHLKTATDVEDGRERDWPLMRFYVEMNRWQKLVDCRYASGDKRQVARVEMKATITLTRKSTLVWPERLAR